MSLWYTSPCGEEVVTFLYSSMFSRKDVLKSGIRFNFVFEALQFNLFIRYYDFHEYRFSRFCVLLFVYVALLLYYFLFMVSWVNYIQRLVQRYNHLSEIAAYISVFLFFYRRFLVKRNRSFAYIWPIFKCHNFLSCRRAATTKSIFYWKLRSWFGVKMSTKIKSKEPWHLNKNRLLMWSSQPSIDYS